MAEHGETIRTVEPLSPAFQERGTLELRVVQDDVIEGYFIPATDGSEEGGDGAKILEYVPSTSELRLYPIRTDPDSRNYLRPKYDRIRTITLLTDVEDEHGLFDALYDLPPGFQKRYQFGLGLTRECEPLIRFIEDRTTCTTLAFGDTAKCMVDGDIFRIGFAQFDELRLELTRIGQRGQSAISRVRTATVHNKLADDLGLGLTTYAGGRLPSSQWMTKVAAGAEPLTEQEQLELVAATRDSAPAIAAASPERLAGLARDIERVSLDSLIERFDEAMSANHQEAWWQGFFEQNVFALQLIFGGPTAFVTAQVPIGASGGTAKGKKIADYLFKHPTTANAALVEIKKPNTRLIMKNAYREGVYGVFSEITNSITQVLDQAQQLMTHQEDVRVTTADGTLLSTAPRCFVVAGSSSELDTQDKQRSFELFREHLSGVRLVTYDEILDQLRGLRDFLSADAEAT